MKLSRRAMSVGAGVVGFSVPFALLFAFSSSLFAVALGPVGWFILGTVAAVLIGILLSALFGLAYEKFSTDKVKMENPKTQIPDEGTLKIEPSPKEGEEELLMRSLIIGDAGTGKSALLLSFSDDSFVSNYAPTIGIDFRINRRVVLDNDNNEQKIVLQIWDTSGQERFQTITSSYYRSAPGVVVTYDVTNRDSFDNIPEWEKRIDKYALEGIPIVLVGMKSDLADERQVSVAEGQKKAKEMGALFYEASAKTGENVEKIFTGLAQAVMHQRKGLPEVKPSFPKAASSSSSGFFNGFRHFLSNIGQSAEPSKTGSAVGTAKTEKEL